MKFGIEHRKVKTVKLLFQVMEDITLQAGGTTRGKELFTAQNQLLYVPSNGWRITVFQFQVLIIIDIPLPIPRSVTCSPSHIRNIVPVTKVSAVVK